MGHARAILALDSAEEQIRLAEKAAAQGLSVRQVEALVQEAASEHPKRGGRTRKDASQDPNVAAAVGELERALGTRVKIVELSDQRGKIEIEYYSQAELDRLFQHIVGTNDGPK
jgi:ParB family chromosome partitioning protein